MPGISFREYLNIRNGWDLKSSTLEEILQGKVDFPYGEHRPLKYYKEYCKVGFYPFFQEEGDAEIRLQNAILATVEDDIPAYAEMTVAATVKLKKLMYILSKSVPFKPSNDTLGRDLSLCARPTSWHGQVKYAERGYLVKDNLEYASKLTHQSRYYKFVN